MEQLLPPLSGEQFSALEEEISKNGCYAPIIVNQDMVIIDGHNVSVKSLGVLHKYTGCERIQ